MKVKIERTKKDIMAKELSGRQFHQRIVKDKTKYNRKENKVDSSCW